MRPPDIEYEPALVEEAVLLALRGHLEERAFRADRDRLYDIADPEAREAAFIAFHGRWFERLALGQPLTEALAEHPEIVTRCGRLLVVHAVGVADESADLLVATAERPTLMVRVRPETLASAARLRSLLWRELLHIADMLDPRFGYEPRLPRGDCASLRDRLLEERYRVLWDTFVDGRLARVGRAPLDVRDGRLREFARAFPRLGGATEAAFERFFGAAHCTHADLVAFAIERAFRS